MHKLEWADDAVEDDRPVAKRILNKISWFSQRFDSITPERLSGDLAGTFKLRIGDWRVIYTIATDVIVIQAIGHRKEIYKG